ncbi:hypothetical protein N7523_004999 [Penicillium sp. IBT 18751x]|nr:hypothetical protein N7523_004999 [Penicillium sp. IBT 18751x]
MDDTDHYDANMDPAFMTSEDEIDAWPASVNSWKISDQFVSSIHFLPTSALEEVPADDKVMAIQARLGSLVLGDLKPSIHIEIIHNLREELGSTIEAACTKLRITDEEKNELIMYNNPHNRSLEAENITVLTYRKRQRAALQKLDQGVASYLVQKVLSNIFKTTCRQLSDTRANLGVENVMHAKASDVLLSYEFLDRIHLPRSLAGTWSNGVETCLNGHYDYPTPESQSWEWAEDLFKRQVDLGRIGATRPASAKEEPRYLLATKAFRTMSSAKSGATLTDKGQGHSGTSNGETPFWHTRGPPSNVTDSEARYQWKLNQSELDLIQHEKALLEAELKETRDLGSSPDFCACANPEDPWYFHLG